MTCQIIIHVYQTWTKIPRHHPPSSVQNLYPTMTALPGFVHVVRQHIPLLYRYFLTIPNYNFDKSRNKGVPLT